MGLLAGERGDVAAASRVDSGARVYLGIFLLELTQYAHAHAYAQSYIDMHCRKSQIHTKKHEEGGKEGRERNMNIQRRTGNTHTHRHTTTHHCRVYAGPLQSGLNPKTVEKGKRHPLARCRRVAFTFFLRVCPLQERVLVHSCNHARLPRNTHKSRWHGHAKQVHSQKHLMHGCGHTPQR